MNIQSHDGDLVREAINREEYWEHTAVGEISEHDGRIEYEVLVVARVAETNTPKLTVYVGGEWDGDVYLGGSSVSRIYDRLWNLDAAFGELYRTYDLEMVDVPATEADDA